MSETPHTHVSEARTLLRRLASHDERSLRAAMAPTPEPGADIETSEPFLDRRTRVLVRLAALIAVGACVESLRWAVELASASGSDDDAMTAVLVATGPAAGSAQLVASAPRLAEALGFELRAGGRADLLLTEEPGLGRVRDRL